MGSWTTKPIHCHSLADGGSQRGYGQLKAEVKHKRVIRSFFFWMDALGTASMIFEISTLLGSFGKMQTANGSVDAMLMRTARAAKARTACRAGFPCCSDSSTAV